MSIVQTQTDEEIATSILYGKHHIEPAIVLIQDAMDHRRPLYESRREICEVRDALCEVEDRLGYVPDRYLALCRQINAWFRQIEEQEE